MKRIPLTVRFMLLKMLQYAVMTCFSSFALAYLKSARALTDSQASLMLMLNTLGAFVGQFIAGRACDRFNTHKKVFIVALFATVPAALLLYTVKIIPLICAIYMLYGLAQIPLSIVTDTWYLDTFPGNSDGYGKVLAAGAVTYAAMSVVYGRMLDIFGYRIMPVCLICLAALAFIVACSIPDTHRAEAAPRKNEAKAPARSLMSAPLVIYILSLMLTCMASYTYSLLPVFMEKVKASNILLGLAMSSSGIFQIPFMLLTGKISRIPARIRSAAAAAIYLTMVLLFMFARSPWPLVVGAGISGAAWGLQLPAYRELVGRLAAPGVRNTAQGVADAAMSLAGAASSGFVSVASGLIGMKGALTSISLMVSAAIVILIIENFRREV